MFKIKSLVAITSLLFMISCSSDDGNNSNESSNAITVQDFSATVDENPTNGQSLGTVQASSNETLLYSIESSTPANALTIDANTGELTVADETLFDYETNPTITATITVENSTETENVTVTISIEDKPEIGEFKYGGVIFWINATGNEGLVCAVADQSTATQWYNGTYINIGATDTGIGFGEANTDLIINTQGTGNYAAQLCHALILNGYDDWFLPSIGELREMYSNKDIINTTCVQNSGTVIQETIYWSSSYWSSTEYDNSTATIVRFYDGVGYNSTQTFSKSTNNLNVRAVRHWTDF